MSKKGWYFYENLALHEKWPGGILLKELKLSVKLKW